MANATREAADHRAQSFTGLLVLDRLSKDIDSAPIVRSVSCAIDAGERVLLLGANGAGKSTLLRICAGVMRATKGGLRLAMPQRSLRSRDVGYVAHQPMFYGELSLAENLKLFAALRGVSRDALKTAITRWQLDAHLRKRPGELSKGLLARASLCRAFLHKPPVLFLDEPSSALDQASCDILLEELSALHAYHHAKSIVLLATHDIARLGMIADRVLVMSAGQLIHDSKDVVDGQNKGAAVQRAINVYLTHNR